MRARLAFGILFASSVLACAITSPTAAGAAATTVSCPDTAQYISSSHSGFSCSVLSPAAPKLWSVTLNDVASYPIIADGMVFETTPAAGGGLLYALNAQSGKEAWGPVPLGSSGHYFTMAYDNGRLFVDDVDGTVVAFNASNGAQLWARTTSENSGEPVATAWVIYVQGPSAVYTISESNGDLLWTSPVLDGGAGAVAVDASGVYVDGGCSQFRLSLNTGDILWRISRGCYGGVPGISWLAGDDFFSQIYALVINETTAAKIGHFAGTPAFDDGNVYLASGNSITCKSLAGLARRFTTTLPSAILAGPVIASGTVYVGTANSKVYGISTSTGKVITTKSLPGVPGGGTYASRSPSDLGLGLNLLVVPTGATVTAFG